MGRYIRLFIHFLRFSFAKATAYRFDFWCRILMDLAYYAVEIGFFKIIFQNTKLLGGWSLEQIMVFVGAHLVLDAVQMTFISANLWELPSTVNKGDLDYYLVKPVNSLFFLSFKEISVNSLVNLLIAGSFFGWALNVYQKPFSPVELATFLFFLAIGFFLYYGFRLLISLPVFWLQSPYGFERIFYASLPLMERPDTIFRGPVRLVILTIIPFGLMVSFPARIFFEGLTLQRAVHMISVLIVLWGIIITVWNKGLRNYSSASS